MMSLPLSILKSHVYKCHFVKYEGGLKRSLDNIAVGDFFDQLDPSTVTLMEDVCRLRGGLC